MIIPSFIVLLKSFLFKAVTLLALALITGDSIFNLLSLGEVETNKDDDRSLDPPPRITSVEVLQNPFEDIIPKVPSESSIEPETETENKDSKKKAGKREKLKKRRSSWQLLSKRSRVVMMY
ncbi:hypothetical protein Peur_045921 [Populus x canadensis]